MKSKFTSKSTIFLTLISLFISFNLSAQLRVGDPGVVFDQAAINANSSCYPQMQRWSQAGVTGGIPFLNDFNVTATISPGDSDDIIAAINAMANSISGSQKGLVVLSNGNYTIDKQIDMKSNVSVAGQSRNGVVLNVYVEGAPAIQFDGVSYAGLYDMTFEGTWGKPNYNWNYGIDANNEVDFSTDAVKLKNLSNNCWLDRITILDIGDNPVSCIADHCTIRDVHMDGSHRKGGGGAGYFILTGSDNLVTGCYVTHLRHISLQKSPTSTVMVDYNVLYDNDFDQEVSFHTRDDGNNLVENNRIILPYHMPPVAPGEADNVTPVDARTDKPIYFAIMGPWSSNVNHVVSANPNYILNNQCEHHNHNFGSTTPWSSPGKVYTGPIKKGLSTQERIDNFPLVSGSCQSPSGSTLYPVLLNCVIGASCDDGDICTINDVIDANCNCVGTTSAADADNDGICDANDNTNGNCTLGGTCDDGDINTINDVYDANCNCAGVAYVACPTSVNSFPHTEDFESGLGQWSQSGGDDLDWTRNSNGTPSSNTGPSSAYKGSWYMYIEASNPNFPAKTAGLISPCFDLGGMVTASLNFQYHMYGNSTDMDLDVQISTDGGSSWSSAIWSQTGNQGNQWNTGTVNLDGYTNQYVMLRFLGTTGETWSGDIALDDMELNASPPACTPGAACNDNDACTTGETYDNNCQCNGGTLVDADNDSVCDVNDQCPGTDDSLIGTSCDDADPCTSGDVYDSSCNCVGTFADADGDGACDANDICTAGDDNADTDNDGTPDACDSCNNNLAGTACEDGDACTTGEIYDVNCSCSGGIFQDSDSDTVCDANDNTNGNCTLGGTCDDGDINTINDVYDANCNCSGVVNLVCQTSVSTFPYTEGFESGLGQWSQSGGDDLDWTRNSNGTPSSNTGPSSAYEGSWYMYIEASNPNYPTKTAGLISPCFNLSGMATASLNFQYHMYGNSTDMDLDVQISTDGGSSWSSAIWSQTGNQGNQWNSSTVNLDGYTNQYVMLRFLGTTGETWSGDIALDDMELNAAPPACTPGTACNDNDACTAGETYDTNCNCGGGTFQDADNDSVCDVNDQCPGTDDSLIGTSCDDADPCTSGDVYDSSCNCVGTFADADGDGACDANDICTAGDDNADTDNDGTPDACDSCDNTLVGTACDDNDACTTGETYDANCNCGGGTFQDSDNDTVCDANDICTNGDDTIDTDGDGTPDACDSCDNTTAGTPCNDNDPCTTNDVFDNNCNCAGTFADADGDGVCDNNDICTSGDDNADSDGDGTPDACDACDGNLAGTACNDNNACTTGETYDANCNCGGGTIQDADSDGVCDANDVCAAGDDNVDTDGDNTPDACDSCPNDANDACGLPTYCASNSTNSNYEFIDNVTFGQINNTSGNNGGYGDFTNISGNVAPGSSVSVSLTAGYPGSSYAENWKIWIDLNRDGDFDDAGEEVFSGSGTGTVTGTVSIPANANMGATGMRVTMQWNADSTPCGSFNYGEVEDYTINLTTSPVFKTNTAPSIVNQKVSVSLQNIISIFPNPASDFVSLDLDTRLYQENATNTADLKIYTMEGKLILQQSKPVSKVIQLNVETLPANQHYFIEMNINNQIQHSAKFLKF